MKLSKIINATHLQVMYQPEGQDLDISSGYSGDLLSQVMAHAQPRQIWLTCQVHRNIIAVASLKDIAAIVLVNFAGVLEPEIIEMAMNEGLAILATEKGSFDLAVEIGELLTPKCTCA